MGQPTEVEIWSSFADRPEKAVAKGVMVKYYLANLKLGSYGGGNLRTPYNYEWWFTYHYLGDNGEKPYTKNPQHDDMGNSQYHTEFHWKYGVVGKHRVNCRGKKPDTKDYPFYKTFHQEVAELDTILGRNAAKPLPHGLPDPIAESKFIRKYADLLWAAGEHGSRVTEMYAYVNKLDALLNRCDRNNIIPFRATYLAKESMEVAELRVFLTYPAGRDDKRMIVDWTNLDEPRLSEVYEVDVPQPNPYAGGAGAGSRADPETTKRLAENLAKPGELWAQGVRAAVDKWARKNRYWPGGVKYELWVKHRKSGNIVDLKGSFETGGKDFAETLAQWLKKVGFYAAMFALVLTGVGSSAAGAIMVMSMVAAATGSILSIQQRASKGQSDPLADAMDVLDIVANCLGVAGKAGEKILWKAGRTVSIESAGAKAVQYMFIGQKYANGFGGILLGASFAKRYQEIMDNKALTAGQRTDQLLALFEEAATAAGLHLVNQKMATDAEKANWSKLLENDAIPRPINDTPSGGSGGSKGTSDGVPKPVTDGNSGPHVVPSDGVPKVNGPGGDSTGKAPVSGTGPTDKVRTSDGNTGKSTTPAKPNADADTNLLRMTDKPGFKGNTADNSKKVTVADKQKRNPTGGVPVGDPTPASGSPKVTATKRLALGLSWWQKNINYVKWAERKGYNVYYEMGKPVGGFDGTVRDAMKTAHEIHVNLDGVDISKVRKVTIDAEGKPENDNYTNHELWLLSNTPDYARKVKWWNADRMGQPDRVRKLDEPDTVQPDGWWPPGLNDPR